MNNNRRPSWFGADTARNRRFELKDCDRIGRKHEFTDPGDTTAGFVICYHCHLHVATKDLRLFPSAGKL